MQSNQPTYTDGVTNDATQAAHSGVIKPVEPWNFRQRYVHEWPIRGTLGVVDVHIHTQ